MAEQSYHPRVESDIIARIKGNDSLPRDTLEVDKIPCDEYSDSERLCKFPEVSVLMLTYNHKGYISAAIESVISQVTSFPFELLVGDDGSVDGTISIVMEYQKKYPEVIRVLTVKENIGMKRNSYRLRNRARGRYIALCEGDDRWLGKSKLQKQRDFLEKNIQYSFCCHGYVVKDFVANLDSVADFHELIDTSEEGIPITRELFFRTWVTRPLTAMYRREIMEYLNRYSYLRFFREIDLFYILLRFLGEGYLLKDVLGVYNYTGQGVSSSCSLLEKQIMSYFTFEELFFCFPDDVLLRNMYCRQIEVVILDSLKRGRIKAIAFLVMRYLSKAGLSIVVDRFFFFLRRRIGRSFRKLHRGI